MFIYLLIALGGALGSVARYSISEAIGLRFDNPFPWGTFIVNLTGSFAIGLLSTYAGPGARHLASNEGRLFLLTGFCGGYTTFSAFSIQTLQLLRAGDVTRAATYIASSIILCILGAWVGLAVGTSFGTAR